jgi:hypothetical protein
VAENRFLRKQRVLQIMAAIPPAVRVAAREGLDEQSAFFVEQVRPRVPREHGDLADSLEWHRNLRGDKISNVITEGRNQPKDPKNRKARAVEFGRPDMAAQPHFFPTYRANKRKMSNAVMKKVRTVIRKLWGTT